MRAEPNAAALPSPSDAGSRSAAAEYIPHIDGLRALAVLGVIVGHLHGPWLPGGFFGVDVFFVISGFVVSASVSRWNRGGLTGLLGYFYVRRMLRIAPALVACLLVTAFASMLVVPFAWLSASNETTGLYAFFGLSNLYLAYQRDGYFSPTAEFNPYTHTWSLGVEEQFYLLFPLLFFAWTRGARGRQTSILLFSGVLVASFCDALLRGRSDPSAAFYLTPSRLWELAAGVLLYQFLAAAEHTTAGLRVREAIGALALATILGVMTFAPSVPLPQAWPVVIATLAVLWALHGSAARSPLARLLGSAPLVQMGRRSYSLYLWHWPVFVVMRWTVGLATPANLVTAIVATAILAELSFRYVESPWRHAAGLRNGSSTRVIAGGLLVLCASAALAHGIKALGPELSLSSVTRNAADWYPLETTRLVERPNCHLITVARSTDAGDHAEYTRGGCASPEHAATIFALGDSHALAYRTLLTEHVLRTGSRVILYDNPGCSFGSLQPARNPPACEAQGKALIADVQKRAKPGDVVFLAALRVDRLGEQQAAYPRRVDFVAGGAAPSSEQRAGEAALVALLQPLDARGVRIVFEAPKPVFAAPAFRCVDRFNAMNPVCAGGLSVPRADSERYRAPAIAAIERVLAGLAQATVWDPLPVLCNATQCSAMRDSLPLFFDGDHPSAHANRLLYSSFAAHVGTPARAR